METREDFAWRWRVQGGSRQSFRKTATLMRKVSDAWALVRCYWSEPSLENREAIRKVLNPNGIRREYGNRHCTQSAGKQDLYFIPPGAEAFRRDNPNATVQFLDSGHFALETHVEEIALAMREFLAKLPLKPASR